MTDEIFIAIMLKLFCPPDTCARLHIMMLSNRIQKWHARTTIAPDTEVFNLTLSPLHPYSKNMTGYSNICVAK